MVTITFQCADAVQAREELKSFAAILSGEMLPAPIAFTTGYNTGTVTTAVHDETQMEFDLTVKDKTAKEPAKRGRKKKEETTAVIQETVAAMPVETEIVRQAPGKPTREAVHTALQQVNSACGLPTARTILSEFNAQRISELKEDMFQSFIAKCSAAVEMQG